VDALVAEGGSAPRCRSATVVVPVAQCRRRNLAVEPHVTVETSTPLYRSEQKLEL
jgi:hypothetical protein